MTEARLSRSTRPTIVYLPQNPAAPANFFRRFAPPEIAEQHPLGGETIGVSCEVLRHYAV